jgi:hypothetical protein
LSTSGRFFVVAAVPLLLCGLVAGAACSRPVRARRAFHFWRTTFSLTAGEKEVLRQHHVERLYLRLFDVAWDHATSRSLPVGRCAFRDTVPKGLEVVPVVFLSNAVFEHQPDPVALAGRVWGLTRFSADQAGFAFSELQLDCDWSDSTREAFFAFCRSLRELATQASVRLSATIRLHQVKYAARTRVPPVDRGMLMFYNMGQLGPAPARSSIFNVKDANRYASFVNEYPLPLDGALAIFSWAIQSRDGKVVGLLEKSDGASLDAVPALRRLDAHRFQASEATFLHGAYLQAGDTLAIESVTPELARQAATTLGRHFHPRGNFAISLFDLDERNWKTYAPQDLEALWSAVH